MHFAPGPMAMAARESSVFIHAVSARICARIASGPVSTCLRGPEQLIRQRIVMIMLVVYFILDLTYNATIAKTVNSILEVQYGLDDIIHQALTVHIFVADIEPHTGPR